MKGRKKFYAVGQFLEQAVAAIALAGWTYASFRECHIEPDWLLIYKIDQDELVLIAQRTGT